jgi:DNA-binding response OmpR family regulator
MSAAQHRILVIEDEEPLARFLKWELETAGFAVQTEPRGQSGLAFAAEHRPDLIILDLRLPDMHGYDVARELRRLYQPWDVPILMLTAMNAPVDQVRGFAFGAEAYLTKPYELEELLQTISLLLGETLAT